MIHHGRGAVITGAANGIGRAAAVKLAKYVRSECLYIPTVLKSTAWHLHRSGLRIVIADVNEKGLNQTAKEVPSYLFHTSFPGLWSENCATAPGRMPRLGNTDR